MEDGMPRYVTSVNQSDIADGWCDGRDDGGCVIDVSSDEVIVTGLATALAFKTDEIRRTISVGEAAPI